MSHRRFSAPLVISAARTLLCRLMTLALSACTASPAPTSHTESSISTPAEEHALDLGEPFLASGEVPVSAPGDSPVVAEPPRIELTDFPSSRWCPSCTTGKAEVGSATGSGGIPLRPLGCSNETTTSEMTIAEAIASGVDLSGLPVLPEEPFQADVKWQPQSRTSHMHVTARLGDRVTVTRNLAIDAGSGQNCGSWVRGSVHVELDSDDGSIAGSFDTQHIERPIHSPSLEVGMDWTSAVQLHGNLELEPDVTRTPVHVLFFFTWYRVAASPSDRVSLVIQLDYAEPAAGPECGPLLCGVQFIARATPPDGCEANELRSEGTGTCVAFVTRGQ
jgi:hypothetical protein